MTEIAVYVVNMPRKARDDRLLYNRDWMRKRRDAWIAEHGPCTVCASTENLEVDHVNPAEKVLTPAKVWSLSPANPVRIAELAKCQVLCAKCHAAKTSAENAVRFSGTRARNAALTVETLAVVRQRLTAGHRSQHIASDLGVSKYVVSRVKRGEAYSVDPAPSEES